MLHHFTAETHLATILTAGFLKTVESNVSAKREHAGPDVVWLTTEATADAGHGLQTEKTAIRFTVELPKMKVHKWKDWARAHGSSDAVIQGLARAGGAGSWRVTTNPIPLDYWVEVRRMTDGLVLLDREQILQAV